MRGPLTEHFRENLLVKLKSCSSVDLLFNVPLLLVLYHLLYTLRNKGYECLCKYFYDFHESISLYNNVYENGVHLFLWKKEKKKTFLKQEIWGHLLHFSSVTHVTELKISRIHRMMANFIGKHLRKCHQVKFSFRTEKNCSEQPDGNKEQCWVHLEGFQNIFCGKNMNKLTC